ncbi:Uncharacterised protein [Porphyromonas cangingivalis]|uniref:Uncharacterized protein n=1 Tax=Porphyromonas cangingivalis TaxID=36874 RepID=A0A1T4NTB1_PORCN|nr:hypothetical protein SAMN02745205_02003 [Porphyromonas cangingivalis]VEJ03881.1 Uncharacterised protein [Porphyromonas cangingivalis]
MSNNTKNSKFFPWGMPQGKKGELTLHTFSDTTEKRDYPYNKKAMSQRK